MNLMPSRYDREAVTFMWKELEQIGVEPLTTAEAVEAAVNQKSGTTLLVVNSVCGCAAGMARPGVALALQNQVIPDRLATVFAGVDMEATQRARELMPEVKPSSPSVFLFKDGKLVHAVHRHDIEGRHPQDVADSLQAAFNEHCERKGPSVAPEVLMKVFNLKESPACGTSFEKDQ
ncbi:BrxA/BrxB family bacilliredoxin [candidate division GN15 bacterium]|nr:BrxA/BrxB family bacilliredoxin [candidate division GN15 bacterium]